MTEAILTDWDQAKSDGFMAENTIAHHNLHERDMFSDDGLIELLDTYPREKLGLYTMGNDPTGYKTFVAGNAFDVPGKDLLEVVKRGRVWLNLRRAESEVPIYGELCDQMFGEIKARTGQKTIKQDLGVLISSPNAQVFYHLDIPYVLLWQIRGEKQVWLYEPKPPFINDPELEGIVLKETEEEFPFNPAWDTQALKVDLKPGMVANWPQFGPHRIVNRDMVNVSLSCEFQTWMSIVRANAVYANGVLRRNFGMNPTIQENGAISLHFKAISARFFKILKLRKSFEHQIPRTFKIDPDAESGISWLPQAT